MNPLRSGGEVNEITDFLSKISRVSLSEPSFLSQNGEICVQYDDFQGGKVSKTSKKPWITC